MKNYLIATLYGLFLSGCGSPDVQFTPSHLETYRPLYHFSPAKGWMNDPNGLVYADGTYHLFFQYYPDSTVWGPMHWGHAVSADLVNWEEKEIAIYPDSLGYIFSGSAVFDRENTSGFGTKDNPPLVAIYTYHDMDREKSGQSDYQSQAIAYSLDQGKSWIKYEGNPVLPNPGIRDFRDPKVRMIKKSDGTDQWVMTLAAKDRIQFFASLDLKSWSLLGEFGQRIGAHGGVWECPDLIPMTAPDGSQKWVLLVSLNPGGPQMGSATQYFIGEFENGIFTPDDTMIRWLDYGPDNYAGVTWSNAPGDRNALIGWMSNWLYAQVVPTEGWRSAMTVPRELSLFEVEGTLLVKSTPVPELVGLRGQKYRSSGESKLPSPAVEILASIDQDDFLMELVNEWGEKVLISKEAGLVTIDRSQAGKADFHPDFAAIHSAPMSWSAIDLRIFLDASSVELFVNDGELVMTSLVFPTSPWKEIKVLKGMDDVQIFELKKP